MLATTEGWWCSLCDRKLYTAAVLVPNYKEGWDGGLLAKLLGPRDY